MSTLQKMDLNKYSLKDNIVHAMPSVLEPSQQVDLEDPEIENISRNLDRFQYQAFTHALTHNLAIIQGPPGQFVICWFYILLYSSYFGTCMGLKDLAL